MGNQDELADRLGLTRGSVGNWEVGKGISRENLLRLAKLSGVSPEWIENRDGPEPRLVVPEYGLRSGASHGGGYAVSDTPPQMHMSADDFLAWSETRDGRYELFEGEVCIQARECVGHAKTKGRIAMALHNAILARGLSCHALPDGMAVRIDADTVFEPDAQVYCGPALPPDAILVESPVIVVEVLSPSTGRNDELRKLAAYFRLSSVAHYLIVSPDQKLVFHHARGEGATIVTRILREGVVALDPPGLTLDLADIYGD